MGLAERRAIKDFQDNRYPELKKQIDGAAGFDVAVEVKWETLAKEGEAHLYAECLPKVFFQPLVEALQSVGADQMGKDALREGLKKVILRNTAGNYYGDTAVSFASGELVIDHDPVTNVDDIADRARAIRKALEKGL